MCLIVTVHVYVNQVLNKRLYNNKPGEFSFSIISTPNSKNLMAIL